MMFGSIIGQTIYHKESFYYAHNDSERQQIHVYYPIEAMRTGHNPCAIYVPGGGWNGHTPDWMDVEDSYISKRLLDMGFVVFYIDFRPTGPGTYWPAQANDWEAAMAFITKLEHSQYFGINCEIVAGWGHSAGGHAVHYLRERGWIKVAVTMAAPTDITMLPDFWEGLFGPMFDGSQYIELAVNASPLLMDSNFSPQSTYTYIIHGSEDNLVPISQSLNMVQRLDDMGEMVQWTEVVNGNHVLLPYEDGVETNFTQLEIFEKAAVFIAERVENFHRNKLANAVITKIEQLKNRALLSTELCNMVYWRNDSLNQERGFEIIEYRVYRKNSAANGSYERIALVNATQYNFLDRNLDRETAGECTYCVTSVANINGELVESIPED